MNAFKFTMADAMEAAGYRGIPGGEKIIADARKQDLPVHSPAEDHEIVSPQCEPEQARESDAITEDADLPPDSRGGQFTP